MDQHVIALNTTGHYWAQPLAENMLGHASHQPGSLVLIGFILAVTGFAIAFYFMWLRLYLRKVDFHYYTIYRQGQPPEVHNAHHE